MTEPVHRPRDRQRGDPRGPLPAAQAAGRFPARGPGPDRHPRGVRARHLRRVHGAGQRRGRARVPDARRPGRRRRDRHGRGADEGRRAPSAAGGVPSAPRAAVRLLHAGHAADRARSPPHATPTRPTPRSARASRPCSAAAPATTASSRPCGPPRRFCAARPSHARPAARQRRDARRRVRADRHRLHADLRRARHAAPRARRGVHDRRVRGAGRPHQALRQRHAGAGGGHARHRRARPAHRAHRVPSAARGASPGAAGHHHRRRHRAAGDRAVVLRPGAEGLSLDDRARAVGDGAPAGVLGPDLHPGRRAGPHGRRAPVPEPHARGSGPARNIRGADGGRLARGQRPARSSC